MVSFAQRHRRRSHPHHPHVRRLLSGSGDMRNVGPELERHRDVARAEDDSATGSDVIAAVSSRGRERDSVLPVRVQCHGATLLGAGRSIRQRQLVQFIIGGGSVSIIYAVLSQRLQRLRRGKRMFPVQVRLLRRHVPLDSGH